jgi:hypothetical protein
VYLVISDNPYGLMFSLSFIWRYFPKVMIEVHVMDSMFGFLENKDIQ